MKLILFLLFPITLSAQFQRDLQVADPQLNLPDPQDIKKGRVLEFISCPLFAGSGFCAGLSNRFAQIDSPSSNRAEIYAIAASGGFVSSAFVWSVGISLQEKLTWKDFYRGLLPVGFSAIGYGIGHQSAELFKQK